MFIDIGTNIANRSLIGLASSASGGSPCAKLAYHTIYVCYMQISLPAPEKLEA